MERIYYIKKEKIVKILFTPVKTSSLKLYPAKPAIKNWFGRVIKKEVPPRYKHSEEYDGYSEEEITSHNCLFLKDGVVYEKAEVTIVFNDNHITKHFKDDGEAMRYAEMIAKESGINFIKL
jgi:hypothetical protein